MYNPRKNIKGKLFFAPVAFFALLFGEELNAQCGVTAGADKAICQGQSATLKATTSSGTPNVFNWTSTPAGTLPSTRSITVAPNATTTYYVHATGNGCDAHDTIVVAVSPKPASPAITFGPDFSCASTPVNFTTPAQGGLSYGWNYGDSTTATGATTSHVYKAYGNGTQNFTVTLTDTNAAGCINSATQVVTVKQGPGALLTAGPGVDTIMFNGNLTFYECAAAVEPSSEFTFVNGAIPDTGVTYTISWGDTGALVSGSGPWTSISHLYGRGIFELTYIVTSTVTGCADTMIYKVFFGSTPSGGIASLGNTDICGPGTLSFILTNYQNNTPGTVYIVSFNDGTPPITYNHPPPDTVTHLFQQSSCGVSSTNGTTVFANSFTATLTVKTPCSLTAGSVLPIYISLPPIADYIPPQTVCTGTSNLFINTTIGGLAASSSGCNNSTPILWNLSPATGWSVSQGNMGSDNGYAGSTINPTEWTTGSNTLGISFTTPGNYTMRLVAANYCGPDTVIKKFCVAAPPSPTVSLSSLSGCAPATITATNTTFDTSTCSAPSYAWKVTQLAATCSPTLSNNYNYIDSTDSVSQAPIFIFNNQGTYSVALNATNVCGTFAITQTVDIKVKPKVTIAAPPVVCLGQAMSPTSNSLACGGTVSAYAWSFSGASPATSVNQNPGSVILDSTSLHTILLAVTNECGTDSTTQNVTVSPIPVANAGPDEQICSSGNVRLGSDSVSGLNYHWTPVTGLNSVTAANPIVSLSNTGSAPVVYTYYLTVSNYTNCSSTDTVFVTVYPAATVYAGPAIDVCAGKTISLNGSFGGAATAVTWTSSNGGSFANDSAAITTYTPAITSGTTTLTLTTNNPAGPCPAVSSAVTVSVLAPPVANAGPDTSVCSGASVNIGTPNQMGYSYQWSPPTGLSNPNVAMPQVTIVNTGANVVTQTYRLVVSATGCSDTSQVKVSIYPRATDSAGPAVSICAGGDVNLNAVIGGSATGAVWTSTSGTFNHANSLITIFTPNIASGTAIATLTTTGGNSICPAAVSNVGITVNTQPSVTNATLAQIVCSGSATQQLNLAANIPGTTFTWTGSSPDGATGFATGGDSATIPAQILNNTTGADEHVNYVITPSAGGCNGLPANYVITIHPQPVIAAIPTQTICSGASSVAVNPATNITGATFSWLVSADVNLTGYDGNGSGNIPAQIITNSGTQADSLTYIITPSSNGCAGTTTSFVIIVEPLVQAVLPPAQTICSGSSSTAVNLSAGLSGANFNWSALANAGVTGFISSGTGNIPAQILTNSATTTGTVTYSITTSVSGCAGPPQNYSITVNPLPAVTATPSSASVCSGTQVNINLTSTVNGTDFSWIVQPGSAISGAGNGAGNSIQQTLSNSGNTTQNVIYLITPNANSCAGTIDTAIISVYPNADVAFAPDTQTICSGQTTQPVTLSSSTNGAAFSWTSQANGITGVAASGVDSIPAQALSNSYGNTLTATYLVTAAYAGCPGQSAVYSIAVNPLPDLALPVGQTICSGTASNAVVLSSNISGTTYTWSGSSNTVTGYFASGTGNTIPAQILTDTSAAEGLVTYNVTPSAAGCTGNLVNYSINVNTGLVIEPVKSQSMCSGSNSLPVTPVANIQNAVFSWNALAGANLSGYTTQGTGTIPAQYIVNNGNASDSIIYTISAAASGCAANNVNYTLWINPIPQAILPANQAICSGNQSAEVDLSSTVDGTVYNWSATASNYLSGYLASGYDFIPAQSITNAGTADDSVTYTITPIAEGCTGPDKSYIILVHPAGQVSIAPAASTICSGTQTNIALSSGTTGITSFNWVAVAPNSIVGAASGTGNTILQTLTNAGNVPAIVTYIVSPVGNQCAGKADTVAITVNPGIDIQFSTGPQTICSGQNSQVVNLSSSLSGVSFSWFSQANGISGVAASGNNIIPVQTLVNTNSVTDSVYYTITASSATCPAQTAYYAIAVKPAPSVSLPAAQSICSGAATNAVQFNTTLPGTVYSWASNASAGIAGNMQNGITDFIPSQTLINTSQQTGTVVYTITLSTTSCSGASATYTVNVAPKPQVNMPASQAICNGASTAPVALSSNLGNTTFSWVATADSSVTGFTGSGTATIPSQTLNNSSPVLQVLKFIITPSNGNCVGAGITYLDTVYPTPVAIAPAPQVVCSGQQSNPVLFTSATPGAAFQWSAAIPNGVAGAISSGAGNIPAQKLYNNLVDTLPVNLTINYMVSTSVVGSACPAKNSIYSITILPKPRIDFIASATTGCSPLSIAFVPRTINYGQPDSLVFAWGDGTANTTVKASAVNPEWYSVNHIFYNTGTKAVTYYVSVTVSNGCFDTTVTHPVTVLPNAINAFFTASPNAGCAPLTVNFQDQSSGASLLSWCFNYNTLKDSCMGGSAVDTAGSTISHTYATGNYTVALYATTGYGCAHDTVYQNIVVSPSPVAAFTPSGNLCSQAAVTFTNTSPGQGSFNQYSWQFGDGATSLDEHPSHLYDTAGAYNVCLTVTSASGCTNSTCQPVVIDTRPVVNFSAVNACVNQQQGQFSNLSAGNNLYQWLFGDGGASTALNPVHNYLLPGNFSVTLIGTNNGCSDTAMHNVSIYATPQAAFTKPTLPGCGLPAAMQLNNASTGAIVYQWYMGNGTNSQFENPVAVYDSAGNYSIMLIATNQNSCADTTTQSISIYAKPSASPATISPLKGCQPLPVIFSINASNASQYVWNFGDGSSSTTAVPFTSHSYPDSGTFQVTIQIYSQGTCGDTINLPDSVVVHPNPTAGFDYLVEDSAQLQNGTIQFINTSVNANTFNWNFGDGSTSADINPSHMFADVNDFEVMLIATNMYGCSDTAFKSLDIVKRSLYVPNAFAPDFSGVNSLVQVWKPAGIGLKTYHAQVFDKWGELLWESDSLTDRLEPAEGWDGSYRGKMCQQGVYVWKIVATFVDGSLWTGTAVGQDKSKKTIGSITLLR